MRLSAGTLDFDILDLLPDPMIVTDEHRVIQRVNPAFTTLFGFAAGDVCGKSTKMLYAEETEFERIGRRRQRDDPNFLPRQFHIRFKRKDGTSFDAETATNLIRDEAGVHRGQVTIVRDISDRVQLHQLLRTVVSLSGDAGADTGRVVASFLEACCTYFDLEAGLVTEIDGDSLVTRYAFDPSGEFKVGDRFGVEDTFCGAVYKESSVISHDQSSGDTRRARPGASPSGLVTYLGVPRKSQARVLGTLCLIGRWPRYRPFSREQRTQLQFLCGWLDGFLEQRESRSRYQLLVETTRVIPWEMDLATWQFTYVGPQGSQLLGFTEEQWCAPDFWVNALHPQDRDSTIAYCKAATNRGEDHDFEYRMVAADGRTVWVRDVVTVIVENGKPVRLRGVLLDITESKLTAQAVEEKNRQLAQLSGMLSQSARNFQRLYRETPAMLHSTDPTGRLVEVSDRWLEKMGYGNRDEVLGRHIREFVSSEEEEEFDRIRDRFWQSGEPIWNLPWSFVRKDGTTFEAELSAIIATPVGDTHGRSLAVVFDVSERNRARRALERSARNFERLYRETPAMLHSIDPQGRVVEVNDHWLREMGYRRDEVLGRPVTDFHVPEQRRRVMANVAEFWRTGAPVNRRAYDFLRKNGSTFEVEISAIVAQRRGETEGRSLAVSFDVTDRNRATSELQKKNAELQRLNDELDSFAALASHDLQEPLRKINQFSRIVEEELGDSLSGDPAFALTALRGAAGRMQTLIMDLLTYAQAANAPTAMKEVRLQDVVSSATDELAVSIEDAAASITVGPLPVVTGDERQIQQLFQNLISNALKYRDPQRACSIEISAEPGGGGEGQRIRIVDNGVGVDAESAHEMFLPFRRLQPKSSAGGSGLGLAICTRIAERHGWTLAVDGTPGRGTTLMIEIPAAG